MRIFDYFIDAEICWVTSKLRLVTCRVSRSRKRNYVGDARHRHTYHWFYFCESIVMIRTSGTISNWLLLLVISYVCLIVSVKLPSIFLHRRITHFASCSAFEQVVEGPCFEQISSWKCKFLPREFFFIEAFCCLDKIVTMWDRFIHFIFVFSFQHFLLGIPMKIL